MIELHGWITIKESYKYHDDDNIDEIVYKIKRYLYGLNWMSDMLDIRFYNGIPSLVITLFKNRYTREVREVFKLITYVSEIAVGSYGIIYLYDDEDKNGKENTFQVFSLVKGKIKENNDNILSPVIPTIEDDVD